MNTSIVYMTKMTLIINYVFFQGENLGGCNNFLFELLNILYTSILWSAVQYFKKKNKSISPTHLHRWWFSCELEISTSAYLFLSFICWINKHIRISSSMVLILKRFRILFPGLITFELYRGNILVDKNALLMKK